MIGSDPAFWNPIVATLGHSLWQSALLALLLAAVLKSIKAAHARLRYLVTLITMVLALAMSIATYALLVRPNPLSVNSTGTEQIDINPLPTTATTTHTQLSSAPETIQPPSPIPWEPILATLWLAGMSLMVLRATWSLFLAERLRLQSVPVTDTRIVRLFSGLIDKARIKGSVDLLENVGLHSPAVVGLWDRAVLLPKGLIEKLPLDAIEAILAHEVTHLRRHDYLINLLQLVMEAVYFFNPAIWWISTQVRVERESSCDSMARDLVGHQGNDYVENLALAFRTLGNHRSAAALALKNSDGNALQRIKRLVFPNQRPFLMIPWRSLTASLIAGTFFTLLSLGGLLSSISLASKVLTPEERIEKFDQLAKEYGIPDDRKPVSRKRIISGVVYTPDGEPYQGNLNIMVYTINRLTHTNRSFGSKDSQFSLEVEFEEGHVMVSAGNYSPVKIGPFSSDDENLENLQVTLQERVPADLKMFYDDGTPVTEGKLMLWLSHRSNATGSSSSGASMSYELAEDGSIQPELFPVVPFYFQIEGDKVTKTKTEVLELKGGEQRSFTVRPSIPLKGIVSDTDGDPIEDAKILVLQDDQGYNYGWAESYLHEIRKSNVENVGIQFYRSTKKNHFDQIVSNESGKFILNGYQAGRNYVLLVYTEDSARIVTGINHNEVNEITLPRNLSLSMTTNRPLKNDESISIETAFPYNTGPYSSTSTGSIFPLEKSTREFYLSPLLYGSKISITLSKSGETATLFEKSFLDEPIEDLFFDIDKAVLTANKPVPTPIINTENIIVEFPIPDDMPQITGTVHVSNDENPGRTIAIKDGRLTIPPPHNSSYNITSKNIRGYTFPEFNIYLGNDSKNVYTVENILPAGAIAGKLERHELLQDVDHLSLQVVEYWNNQGDSSFDFRPDRIEYDKETGRFITPPLPLGGTYRLKYNDQRAIGYSAPIRVDENTPFPEITIPYQEDRRSFIAKITDSDGKPMPNLEVVLRYNLDYNLSGFGLRTDTSGILKIEEIVHNDELTSFLSIKPQGSWQGIKKSPITAESMTIQLEPGYTAFGKVQTIEGHPVYNAEVRFDTASLDEDKMVMQATTRTDEEGNFKIRCLSQGEYVIRVDGMTDEIVRRYDSHTSTFDGIALEVKGDVSEPILVTVNENGLIHSNAVVIINNR